MFSEGRENVNDEENAERLNTSTTDENIDGMKKIVKVKVLHAVFLDCVADFINIHLVLTINSKHIYINE